jgi:uncharacterized protein (TIGR00269 family)
MLPAAPGLAAKIKPLCRLGADEIRAYALVHDLPVAQGSCPRSKGATLPFYQEAMRFLEEKMPGTKLDFYLGFLRDKAAPPAEEPAPHLCQVCGSPSHIPVCSVCGLLGKARRRAAERAQSPSN